MFTQCLALPPGDEMHGALPSRGQGLEWERQPRGESARALSGPGVRAAWSLVTSVKVQEPLRLPALSSWFFRII